MKSHSVFTKSPLVFSAVPMNCPRVKGSIRQSINHVLNNSVAHYLIDVGAH
jgi:hypothetical protein